MQEKLEFPACAFDLTGWSTLAITGKDSLDFLNRMTTADFKRTENDQVAWGAFLTGRGGVVALGLFERTRDSVLLHLESHLLQPALEHIEQFHFQEEFSASKSDHRLVVLNLPGDFAGKVLGFEHSISRPGEWHPEPVVEIIETRSWWDPARRDRFWLRFTPSRIDEVHAWVAEKGIEFHGASAWEYLRVRDNIAAVPGELGAKDIILEGNCGWAVARNKGCYPGQEVVERIFTYGSVNRKLRTVEIQGIRGAIPAPGLELPGFKLVSVVALPGQPVLGHAYVDKRDWERKEPWTFGLTRITLRQ